jgi:hypothetical protein
MEIDFEVYVTLIPIFADNNYHQADPNYYKILLAKDKTVLRKKLVLSRTIEDTLLDLYDEYLKIDREWTFKTLYNCKKYNNSIDITYICKMPYIKDCEKDGIFVNINDFMSTIMDEYYVKIVTSNSPESFR